MTHTNWPNNIQIGNATSLDAGLYGSVAPSSRRLHHISKRAFDVLASGSALLFLSPLLLLLYFLVKSDGGDALFGHKRIGRNGRSFACLKFRSMVPNAGEVLAKLLAENPEAARTWAETRKLQNDPRVTRIGKFLRSTSLDELPQLVNVLRGEMSLVGPRPVVQEELTQHYGAAAASYMAVRPGITGLWQISGRSDTSYAERVALDSRYVREFSFWTDLRILVKTVPAVLFGRGAY
ncbi:sugar transferase [Pseudoroseomonas globiformis]|uniref:Sugar transferase n=1 Tax=Teichococcus globiformis TaxID=2307229 RepID=A0ABV7G367_9PROT